MKKVSLIFSVILLNIIISYKIKDVLIVDYSTKSFTKETASLLSSLNLSKELKIDVFHNHKSKAQLANIYALVKNYIPAANVRFFDADFNPEKITKHNIIKVPSSVIEFSGKKVILEDHNELNLVNSILSVTKRDKQRLVFLTGQGQASLSLDTDSGISHLLTRIDQKIFDVVTLDLLSTRSMKSNDLVISVGQTRDFNEEEIKKLKNAQEKGADFIFMIDPYFKASGMILLNRFLGEYGLRTEPGYVKVKKNFVNGSNGLAPIFSDRLFHGTRVDRAFFPFSTAIFADEEANGESDFFIKAGDGAFLRDIELANNKEITQSSKDRLFISRKSKKKMGNLESRIFVIGNSTFIKNKFKDLFDSKIIFHKIVDITSQDMSVKSLNIPMGRESAIHIEKKIGFVQFFTLLFSVFCFLILTLNLFLKPKRNVIR